MSPCGSVRRFYHVRRLPTRSPNSCFPISCSTTTSPCSARRSGGSCASEMTAPNGADHRDRRDLTGWDEAFERGCSSAPVRPVARRQPPDRVRRWGEASSWQAVVSFEAVYHDAADDRHRGRARRTDGARFGSDAQRGRFLPAATAGSCTACIAYTEAGAGSDLANITTTAVADGDGTASCSTARRCSSPGAHKSDWCCTIAGTDPASRGLRGLSMFLIDLRTPGVTVERVPTAQRLDARHDPLDGAAWWRRAARRARQRWRQLGAALLSERSGMAWLGWATRNVACLLDAFACTTDASHATRSPISSTRLFIGFRHAERVLAIQDAGGAPVVEAAISKVWATELLQRIAVVGDASDRAGHRARAGMVR